MRDFKKKNQISRFSLLNINFPVLSPLNCDRKQENLLHFNYFSWKSLLEVPKDCRASLIICYQETRFSRLMLFRVECEPRLAILFRLFYH